MAASKHLHKRRGGKIYSVGAHELQLPLNPDAHYNL